VAIKGGLLLTPQERYDPGLLVICGETIDYAGSLCAARVPAGARSIDATGRMIVPGFIDLHVHGAGGRLFAGARDSGDVVRAARALLSSGTTGFLATVGSIGLASKDDYVRALELLSHSVGPGDGSHARLHGIHLEGPRLSMPGVSKAWPTEGFGDLLEDAKDMLRAAKGTIRIAVTSPELPGAKSLTHLFVGAGAIVSVGHTGASYEEGLSALAWGVTHATHTFNAMSRFHHRAPGLVLATLLSPQVTNEVIGDGVHLHPAVAGLMVRVKPRGKVALVSDGVGLESARAGSRVMLGGTEIKVLDDRVTLLDGTLAGGKLSLNMLVRNMVRMSGVDLEIAVELATSNPARELGLWDVGTLAPGKRADVVVLEPDFSVFLTCCGGMLHFPDGTQGGSAFEGGVL
jgi:N-acetylglucosamine-6-phosphate deacetylase